MSSLLEKSLQRRIDKGENLDQDDLLKWYTFHPELRPEGWTHPKEVAAAPDLIPDIEPAEYVLDDLDAYLDGIDILDAYGRYCGKMQPKVGSKSESIMVSCPNPAHPDATPSSWINLDKQVGYCGVCEIGYDKFHIAAWGKGYPVPEYQRNGDFPKLRREMAEDYGAIITRTPGGTEMVLSEPEEVPITSDPSASGGPDAPVGDAEIISFPDMDDIDEFDRILATELPFIPWETLVPPETFLYEWMTSVTIDDLPHEYYFWLGLQALSCAAGDDVILLDYFPVKTNLFVVLYGKTASGKSRALRPYIDLLHRALPYDYDPTTSSKGIKILPAPGSSEALLASFQHELVDTSTSKVTGMAPVRGLLRVEEFASFVSKSSRHGNPMKETLIELFDSYKNTLKHYSRTGGHIQVESPYAVMVTTTQPKAIHTFMRRSDADSGFMNRWIFAVGARRRDRISHGGVSMDIDDAVTHLKFVHAWCSTGHEMKLEGDALKIWDDFYQSELSPLLDKTDESMFGRIDLNLKKIIVLFTINEKLEHPTADIVERVITLYNYLRLTYRMFSSDIAYTESEECQNKILSLIENLEEKIKGGPTLREIVKFAGRKFNREQIERALKTLEVLDLVRVRKAQGQRGRETKRYVVNAD